MVDTYALGAYTEMCVGSSPIWRTIYRLWGCSSVGRASALQAEGRQFESDQLHHNSILI